MPESREPRTVIDAAEQAAAAGDYASAEQLLRDAARLQEAAFGALHPDLANTLNNLGIVCEITNKPTDAERFYRQACAIATAVLAPDHPFAVTSRKNLADFCEARGRPIESPMALPAIATEQEPPVVKSVRPHVRPFPAELLRFAFRGFSLSFTIIVLSLCGLVLMMLIATSAWLRSNGQADSSPVSTISSQTQSLAPGREPAEPITVRKEVTANNRGPVTTRARTRTASAPALTLASASLCRNLSTEESRSLAGDWRCDPASRPVDSGALFFYTRLKSPTDTTVQHRWYRDDRLYQSVELRIGANQRNGYRTFSRYNMSSRSAGNWRVELRSRDGILLHEERFAVR